MSTTTMAKPEVLLRPPDDARRTPIGRRVVMAVLGLTAAGGIVLAAGANSAGTSPVPGPTRAPRAVAPRLPHGPTVVPGCLADIQCSGESQLVLNSPGPQQHAVAVVPESDGPTSTPAD